MSTHSFTQRVMDFLTARPNVWIDATAFEHIGGRQAWRTRISEARRILEAERRGTIKNRCQTVKRGDGSRWTRSQYCYQPETLFDLSVTGSRTSAAPNFCEEEERDSPLTDRTAQR